MCRKYFMIRSRRLIKFIIITTQEIIKRQFTFYNTRNNNKAIYFLPRMNKRFSQKTLSFKRTKLWKEVDNDIKSLHWVSFKKAYEQFLLQSY